MTLYIGVDFHPHQQTVCWCDLETGEIKTRNLFHNSPDLKKFYQNFPRAIVGIEASTNAPWFEKLLLETNHQLVVGNPSLIRAKAVSRHKSDKRDAELIFELLCQNRFPVLWRRPLASTNILEILKLRLSLVKQRTQICNRLQSLAHGFGLPKGRVRTKVFQAVILQQEVDEVQELQRNQLFTSLENLDKQIIELETWLQKKAENDRQGQLLMTQKGVGYLSALTVVHTLGDVSRFTDLNKQIVAFAGLDPLEKSSGGKVKMGSISKKGSWMLRFMLGQAGNIAARYDAKLKGFKQRLGKKKVKAVVKTAVARKLLVKLAIMLKQEISAQEFDQRGSTVGNARLPQGQK